MLPPWRLCQARSPPYILPKQRMSISLERMSAGMRSVSCSEEEPMKHLIITDARIAGHCTTGTSNKVWTACVAVESEDQTEAVQAVVLATVPSTAEVIVLCGHGPQGAALRLEEPKKMSRSAAQTVLRKKWQEKAGKGYAAVSFGPFVSSFGRPFGLPLVLPGSVSTTETAPESDPASSLRHAQPAEVASLPHSRTGQSCHRGRDARLVGLNRFRNALSLHGLGKSQWRALLDRVRWDSDAGI